MILANQDQMSRDKLIISVNLLNEETKEQVTKLFAKSKRVRWNDCRRNDCLPNKLVIENFRKYKYERAKK